MRLFFFGNNWVAWQVCRWLRARGEQLVGMAVHAAGKQQYTAEILAAGGLPPAQVLEAPQLHRAECLRTIADLQPELGICILFDELLQPELLDLFPRGIVNLHPALLPYNRGQYPNVWSIVEGTPAGVTLHFIDSGIDTGPIIAQREVAVDWADTGETLYRKLERAAVALFQETWPLLKAGNIAPQPQPTDGATTHRRRDVEAIDAIDLERTYTAAALINILRARTFPPHRGAYFEVGGRRIYLRLQLEEEHP